MSTQILSLLSVIDPYAPGTLSNHPLLLWAVPHFRHSLHSLAGRQLTVMHRERRATPHRAHMSKASYGHPIPLMGTSPLSYGHRHVLLWAATQTRWSSAHAHMSANASEQRAPAHQPLCAEQQRAPFKGFEGPCRAWRSVWALRGRQGIESALEGVESVQTSRGPVPATGERPAWHRGQASEHTAHYVDNLRE